MISGSGDKTTRQWDLESGREIEARDVCEQEVLAVGVSRVVTAVNTKEVMLRRES